MTLELLLQQPEFVSNTSESVMYRINKGEQDAVKPPRIQLLLDEVDSIFGGPGRDHANFKGILNSGYTYKGRVARGAEKKGWEPEFFPTFFPKAFSGVGTLPATLADRCVRIEMHEMPRDAELPWLDHEDVEAPEAVALRMRLSEWGEKWEPKLHRQRSARHSGISARTMQIWNSLFVIADVAGLQWGVDAREAAVSLSRKADRSIVGSKALLRDIQIVCTKQSPTRDHMWSGDLVDSLIALPGTPWASWGGGGLDTEVLAKLLSAFQISPVQIQVKRVNRNGYRWNQFLAVWDQELFPASMGSTPPTPSTNGGVS
jgi:hypothetical protein